jgi:hypothetical protein
MQTEVGATPTTISPKAVRDQLQRLLESSHFNHSRRYPGFLRYVVDQALKGKQDQLKERSIGIDVFGRAPDYDLNIDPVVRVTAGEVRKRLAQYYYETEHRHELRIELHPGSYIPDFKLEDPTPAARPQVHVTVSERSLATEAPAAFEVPPFATRVEEKEESLAETPLSVVTPRRSRRRYAGLSIASVLLLVGIGSAALYFSRSHSALEHLWQPIWSSPAPVLISVGSWDPSEFNLNGVSIASHAKYTYPIALADAITVSGLQQLLSRHGKPSLIQTSNQTSFADLQRGTTVLVSGFDNRWVLRLTDPLRFHFVIHNKSLMTIEDRQNPGRSDWQLDDATPYSNLTHDYAIVARFHDPTTEQMIVVAAGIGENGTLAAGQVLSNGDLLESISKGSGLAGNYRNMEAVIETQVIDGKSGPPRIIALTFW